MNRLGGMESDAVSALASPKKYEGPRPANQPKPARDAGMMFLGDE